VSAEIQVVLRVPDDTSLIVFEVSPRSRGGGITTTACGCGAAESQCGQRNSSWRSYRWMPTTISWITTVIHVSRVRSVASLRAIPCNRWQNCWEQFGGGSCLTRCLPLLHDHLEYFMTISSWGLNATQAEAVFNFANCGVPTRSDWDDEVPFTQF
jgi:hypothetical protein